jgi:hypothetical protein
MCVCAKCDVRLCQGRAQRVAQSVAARTRPRGSTLQTMDPRLAGYHTITLLYTQVVVVVVAVVTVVVVVVVV